MKIFELKQDGERDVVAAKNQKAAMKVIEDTTDFRYSRKEVEINDITKDYNQKIPKEMTWLTSSWCFLI